MAIPAPAPAAETQPDCSFPVRDTFVHGSREKRRGGGGKAGKGREGEEGQEKGRKARTHSMKPGAASHEVNLQALSSTVPDSCSCLLADHGSSWQYSAFYWLFVVCFRVLTGRFGTARTRKQRFSNYARLSF